MKKILIGTYSGFDMDDPEDMTTHSYTIKVCDSDEEIYEIVDKEFDDFIDEEVNNRFNLDDPDEAEEAKIFAKNFDIRKLKLKDTPLYIEDLIGELTYVSDYYVETYKIYAITIEK